MGAYDGVLMLQDTNGPFTAMAGAAIQSGWIVKAISSDDVVVSGTSSYATSDIIVDVTSDSLSNVGIALTSAASGAEITILREGIYILPAGSGAVTSGYEVTSDGYGSGTTLAAMVSDNTIGTDSPIGHALTGASAVTKYCIVALNL